MSYTSIYSTSETLRLLIENDLKRDVGPNGLAGFFDGGGYVVSLSTPHEMDGNEQGVSLWLYRVLRDDTRLNDPPQLRPRASGGVELIPPPLPLRLHYLVTPLTSDSPDTEQKILGRVLQLFHALPTISGAALQGDLSGTNVEINARLESLSLDELTRVWDALEGSYQLSVSYEVTLANIESIAIPVRSNIVESVRPDFAHIMERNAS